MSENSGIFCLRSVLDKIVWLVYIPSYRLGIYAKTAENVQQPDPRIGPQPCGVDFDD